MAKKAAGTRAASKAEIINGLSEKTGLGKKQVGGVLAALSDLVARELGKKGPGVFVLPGMLKLKVVRKPATKAKQGINPFTKAPMMIKAKPARNVVRALPLKSLKELV
jgi:nucleoid DNA-binding protein